MKLNVEQNGTCNLKVLHPSKCYDKNFFKKFTFNMIKYVSTLWRPLFIIEGIQLQSRLKGSKLIVLFYVSLEVAKQSITIN